MNWRVHVLVIAVPLTVAASFSLAAVDATVTLECASAPTAPQCPPRTSSGLLLISARESPLTTRTTKTTLAFGTIDDSFKEAMAFRKDSAPGYKQVTWATDETLAFKGHERLPLRIWAICTDTDGACPALNATRRTKLEKMVANANSALTRERAGIMLVPAGGTLISDESGTPAMTALKAVDTCAALKVKTVGLNKFEKGALNLYIVHTVEIDGQAGMASACSNFRDVAAVGAKWSWALILHEIGHMLALDDVWDNRSDWGSDPVANFMRHASGSRKFFTEGQIFRMHLDQNSAINRLLNSHPNDGRDCEASNPTLPCPKLNVRVWDEP